MIAVERPEEAPPLAEPVSHSTLSLVVVRPGRVRLGRRPSALVLMAALLAALAGSAGVLDTGIALGTQGRAAALHQRWAAMRADGIPDADLAALEQEIAKAKKRFQLADAAPVVSCYESKGNPQPNSLRIRLH